MSTSKNMALRKQYPSLSRATVLAVPGGRWRIGSDTVTSFIGGDYGFWATLPMHNCIKCKAPNAWELCWECGGTMPLPFNLPVGVVVTEALVGLITHHKSSDKTHRWLCEETSHYAIELIRSDPEFWGADVSKFGTRYCRRCRRMFKPRARGSLQLYCSTPCARLGETEAELS